MAELVQSISELRERISRQKQRGAKIGFVPTMGALHGGHTSLIEAAKRECEFVVVSIFVNPIQFNNQEDYQKYGRNLPADLELCRQHGVDLVFAPAITEMYPKPQEVFVDVPNVAKYLCGEFRPGHFRAIATVVTKLFNMVQPQIAYFGEKDAQQLAVVRRMAAELNAPIEICGMPTVREADGLAMSSRNERLNPVERKAAPILFKALQAAKDRVEQGATDAAVVKKAGLEMLAQEPTVRVEYFEIVDADEMQPVSEVAGRVCIATAAWLGSTRLIDNVLIETEIRAARGGLIQISCQVLRSCTSSQIAGCERPAMNSPSRDLDRGCCSDQPESACSIR